MTLPIASPRETARTFLALLGTQRRYVVFTLLLLITGSAAALFIPIALGWVVDAVIDRAPVSEILRITVLIFLFGLSSAVLSWCGGVLLVGLLQKALATLREEVFSSALTIDAQQMEKSTSSDIVSRVTSDVEAVTEAISEVLPTFVQALFVVGLTMIGIVSIDPFLACGALLAIPLQLLSTRVFMRRSGPMYRELRQQEAERGQSVIEAVRGADTLVAHRAQGGFLNQIAELSLRAVEKQRDIATARNLFNGGINAGEFVGLAAVLILGFWRVDEGAITVGAATAAALFFHRLFEPVGTLLASLDDIQRAETGLERLVGITSMTAAPAPRQPSAGGSVQVRDLSFSYDTKDCLHGITLDVQEGEKVVLVGASGSGKSTLAKLIAGNIVSDRGTVTIGATPATQATTLLITQDIHLFGGTIADNLRLAQPEASDGELADALAAVGATWCTQVGAPASRALDQAQIQHIALARVLLADPAVVILDEATAHDAGDGRLESAIAAVTKQRTAVIVAHRLGITEQADRIVVMKDGRIVESGTHAQLLVKDSHFAALWRAWKQR